MWSGPLVEKWHAHQTELPRSRNVVQRDLSGPIGTVVEGVDLSHPLTDSDFDVLRSLVTERHVVFLRGQETSEETLRTLAERFGSLSTHPLQAMLRRDRKISIIEDTPSRPPAGFPWHTDLSWLKEPPRFGFLQALDIPERGGDTLWVSLPAAYRALSPAFQSLVASRSAVHRIDQSFRDSVARHHGREVAADLEAIHPPVAHPLVRRHPDTGEASLYFSPLYTTHIEDLHPSESALLIGHLERLIEDPNIAVRWHWQPGDIAIWDEASTVHRALVDHHPFERRMRRCTVAGGPIEAFAGR